MDLTCHSQKPAILQILIENKNPEPDEGYSCD